MSIDQSLEHISDVQKAVSNRLLALTLDEACNEHDLKPGERKARQSQAGEFESKMLGEEMAKAWSFDACVEKWWASEVERIDLCTEAKIYRVLVMFGRNYNLCPFTKEKKKLVGGSKKVADSGYFEKTIGRHFQSFCEKSLVVLLAMDTDTELVNAMEKLATCDLDRSIYSARYALLNKDMTLLKGVAIGTGMGVLTSIFLGPVIGGMIGEAAGFSGAAATSYGLAVLGGGSIASGGFGMAGGSAVLGVLFSGAGVAKDFEKSIDPDLLNLCHARANVPVLLCAGRLMREVGFRAIGDEIHSMLAERSRQLEDRQTSLKRRAEPDKEKLKSVNDSFATFVRAKDLSKLYNWTTGYDIYKKMAG